MQREKQATGKVKFVLGNLIRVEFEGEIKQGEIGFVQLENESLKCEVIAIEGKIAKIQVYEDTFGIKHGTPVIFTEELLEVELGPGILATIFDGLQNPLKELADISGLFLERGKYIEALNRTMRWEFKKSAKIGDVLIRGDAIGHVPESHFKHAIMLPFSFYGKYKLTWIIDDGNYVVDEVIAKVEDEKGREFNITMLQRWPIKFPLSQGTRVKAKKPLSTGIRIIDTLMPLCKGSQSCIPGPFGAGKTVTQQLLAKYSDVDIVVIAACGERAGEVVETLVTFPKLVDVHSNKPLMERTVIICNTSSMPVAAREASVYVGMVFSEYYRQMGLDVLLLADSTSRWAQAMREMSGRLEEIPGEEAFPAYLSSRIAAFYERAGALQLKDGEEGTVSVLGAVSPAGGDMTEPVTQSTMNVVGCFICLSREISDQRKYPAIDPVLSWSTYIDCTANEYRETIPEWGDWVKRCNHLIVEGDEIGRKMEVVGLEGTSMDDIVTHYKAELFSFAYLQQNAYEKEDAYCSREQQKVQFKLMNKIIDTKYKFSDADEAKKYFLKLQNDARNINMIKFESKLYNEAVEKLYQGIQEAEEKSRTSEKAGL